MTDFSDLPDQDTVVEAGDTLRRIAERFYGDENHWLRIFNANRNQISDPDNLLPGQVLLIPGFAQYTVMTGDTLRGLAQRFYGDENQWPRIFDAVRDQISDPDNLLPGEVLRLPTDDRYAIVAGDTLRGLAQGFYGAETYWPIIFDANRDQIEDPEQLFPGQVLRLPTRLYKPEVDALPQETAAPVGGPISGIAGPPEHDLSTHIATDIWTLKDSLGYQAYAYAIYRFLTHPKTRPPLTISIQAPWGGGKTSLMRMIQHALDPDAANAVREEAHQPRGELTVKRALKEIDRWISSKDQQKHDELPKSPIRTVWFNAWKYESTNQVWSGLVDAIMQQVAARLSLLDREIFWLQLNMKRIDADKIRQRIYERVLRYWWRRIRTWVLLGATLLVSSVVLTLTGWLTDQPLVLNIGWIGGAVSAFASTGFAITQYFRAKAQVEAEPAASSLADYLDAPNYREELGFVHHVEADLRRVLASVPQELRPIVVFIDDLDRCSPGRVAQVVEAVNLFLAGEFPDCIFVLGMDPEMVAASLQAAYKDMIEFLPADAGIPVGWRFMDKFVQLPFHIPPSEPGSVTRYTTSLLSVGRPTPSTPSSRAEIETQSEATVVDPQAPETAPITAQPVDQPAPDPETVQRRLDEGIREFDKENPELRRILGEAAVAFRGNPRELKRFINAFRFQYYLWWARRAQQLDAPSLDQLVRWTALAMKWPEVVRWLWRDIGHEVPILESSPDGESALIPAQTRLEIIEYISAQADDLSAWQQHAEEALGLTPQTTPWLADENLFRFFHAEGTQHLPVDRLSAASGKGLW